MCTATHCNTLHHTATHCNKPEHTATPTPQHTSTHCNTLQHAADSLRRYRTSLRVTWLMHMCDMTHSQVWHAAFTSVTSLIHMCDMPHSFVWQAAFTSVTCLIHSCDKPPDAVRLGAEIGLAVMGRVAWERCITCGGTHYHIHNRNVRGR